MQEMDTKRKDHLPKFVTLETAVQAFGKAEDTAKQEAAGQLLFAAVNAARLAGADAEEALTFASKRFAQQCLEQEQSGIQVE